MDVTAIAIQQMIAQTNAALSFVRHSAQADAAFNNMLAQNSPAPDSGRGQGLDISI